MILRHFLEDSLAQSAYLVGCPATGEALVVDPTIDIQQYIDAAAAEGLRITGVAETHIHADYVSGTRALAVATGATPYLSGEGGPDWQYAWANEPGVRVLRHGDTFRIGCARIQAVHTPGHTPEHLMFVLTDTAVTDRPLGAFTGDFLFVGDVGRPDLLETAAGQMGTMETSARRLFGSLQRTLADLPEHLLIWPGHGRGSACGKSLGGVPASSLGYERIVNWGLRETDEDAFVSSVLADQPDPPMYFAEMKRVNKIGEPAWMAVPAPRPLNGAQLADAVAAGTLIVDTRPGAARAGLLPGALAVPPGRLFSTWAGSVVPSATRFIVIAEDESRAEVARRSLALIGRREAVGWASAIDVASYESRGGVVDRLRTMTNPAPQHAIVDVRTGAEWRLGHLSGARHLPLARLPERVATAGLDRSAPVLVYCQAGARAAVAATAMRRLGFGDVSVLEGGLDGYRQRTAAPALAHV
jgi:hydroxyacylglutathione hydrolase